MNKHALSFVNALCKSTHTLDQRYTTPRVTENDAPYLCVYVCVVCVGGSRSNDNTVLGQSKTYSFPNEFPTRPPYEKTGVPHQYTQITCIQVYKCEKPPTNVESFFLLFETFKNLEFMCCIKYRIYIITQTPKKYVTKQLQNCNFLKTQCFQHFHKSEENTRA